MPRGRLIFPRYAEILRLDPAAMDAAGDYDDVFHEPIKTDGDGDGIGEHPRKEKAAVTVAVQIETNREELQRMSLTGNIPDSAIGLVVHMRNLERDGLVVDGAPDFHVNDRLQKITDRYGDDVMVLSRVPMYLTHCKLIDGWIGSRRANLALLMFDDRPQGRS